MECNQRQVGHTAHPETDQYKFSDRGICSYSAVSFPVLADMTNTPRLFFKKKNFNIKNLKKKTHSFPNDTTVSVAYWK